MTRGIAPRRLGADLRDSSGSATGTFGELLQGTLPDGTDFLVTLPITLRSSASFRLLDGSPIRVYPSHKRKSARLARMLVDTIDPSAGGMLVIDSDVPTGKGLSSSSADLVATHRAVGSVLGLDISPQASQEWLRLIEPTDGVMYQDVVAFDHRDVQLRAILGPVPALTVLAVDEGGRIDTIAFNEQRKPFTPTDRAEFADLLDELATAVVTGNLRSLGRVASRSSQLNQALNRKRNLAALLGICSEVGALGVGCTHSGTMLGILFDPADQAHPSRLAAARMACTRLPGRTHVYSTTGVGSAI